MENLVAAPLPLAIAASSIRAALQRMLQDVEQSKNGDLQKPPRSYANWRARSIIKEIASLRSPGSLIEFEKELRDVLYFQELRRRTKIINEYLYGECNLIELSQLEKDERQGREAIHAEWHHLIEYGMHICQYMWDEEVVRHQVVLEHRSGMRTMADLSKLSLVRVREVKDRQKVIVLERLSVEELRQRRLIEVGQEIHYEILRQSLMSTFIKMHRYAMDFIKDYKTLFRAEERDRIAIQKLGFLNFGVLMNEAESDLVRVLRKDIESHAQKKANGDAEEAAVLAWRDQKHLLEHESQIRMMVVENEEVGWEAMYSQYIIGWRAVYHTIAANTDIATMVSSLELFERRYIHDQYRHGIYGLESLFREEHCLAEFKQKQYVRFFDDYLNGALAIWKQENIQFNVLRDRYSRFLVEARSIQRAKVLVLEEEMRRRQQMGEEVRQLLYLKRFSMRDKCRAHSLQAIQTVRIHEDSEWEQIMYHFQQQCILIPQEELRRSEYLARLSIENEETVAHIDLHLHCQKLQHDETIYSMSSTLAAAEKSCRSDLLDEEMESRQHLINECFLSAERYGRRTVRRHERYHRATLHMQALEQDDLYEREKILTQHQAAVQQCRLGFLRSAEETERHLIVKSERKRRDFVIGSVPYEHLLIRACEVDELAHRLDNINEAELTIRACAYTFGHDMPVAYCSIDLRLLQAQLHFQSLPELLEGRQREFVCEAEPAHRRVVEREWMQQLLQYKTMLEEGRCRLQLNQKEESDWWSLSMLFSRVLGRQKEYEARLIPRVMPKPLTYREELMLYLQQQRCEASEAYIRKKRQAIREGLSHLMEQLYWSRDAIIREEAVERQGLRIALKSGSSSALFPPLDEGSAPQCSASLSTFWLHNVIIYNPGTEQRAVTVLIRHSDEMQPRRAAMKPFHVVHVAAKRMEVVMPEENISWVTENTSHQGVVFFTVLDKEGKVVATASHLLTAGDADHSCVSVELDGHQGQVHLARYPL